MKESNVKIIKIIDNDFDQVFALMHHLRPSLVENEFQALVQELQDDGYCLLGLYIKNKLVALGGYRISKNLFMGKHLYVDDLVTDPEHRSKGYGKELIQHLRELAVKESCNYIHLDSGTHRHQAHKFYFKQGFNIASYHFSENLKG